MRLLDLYHMQPDQQVTVTLLMKSVTIQEGWINLEAC